jgi:hypothetical protein
MSLRSLRHIFLATAFLTALIAAARAAVVYDGLAAGEVSSTNAVLWTRADNGGYTTNLTAQIATDPDFANIVRTLNGTTSAVSDFTLKLDATGLANNTHYYYRFLASDGVTSDIGQFTTAPMPSEKVDVRFGFSGDGDGRFRPYPSITNLASHKLNYFIFLGDTMYETPDAGSPAVPTITGETADPASLSNALTAYDQKYLNNVLGVNPATGQPSLSGQQSLQPMLAATGTYTLLDNHELGNRSLQSAARRPSPYKARQIRLSTSTRRVPTTTKPWHSRRSKNPISITTRPAPLSWARRRAATHWPDRRSQHPPTRAATARRSSIFRNNGAPIASISRPTIAAIATSACPSSAVTERPTIWAFEQTTPTARCWDRHSSSG